MKRRKAIGKAIRTQAEAYLADGTISTEPKGKDKVTGKDPVTGGPVDNYSGKEPSVVVNPDDGSKPVRKVGVYAHLELKGNSLSESQKKMLEMYDEKKKKDEKELAKKDKVSSMMTKDSVKKEDEKEEEKPDMRSKYAMINIIKNKLRAAGQRDPMVMAVDACEERTPAKGDDSFKEFRKGGSKFRGDKNKGSEPSKPSEPLEEPKKDTVPMPTPPKKEPKPTPPKKQPKPTPPKTRKPKYNPYGPGTANPENMAPGRP